MIDADIRVLDFADYLEVIRRFTIDDLIPQEREMVHLGEVPQGLMDKIANLGLFGITLPTEWGGLGWSMEEQVHLTMVFTQASCVYRSRFSTTIGLCSQLLVDHGTDSQKRRYLRRMANGECVAAFALTEPGAGSDVRSLTTTAVRTNAGWVLNGHKRYITNAAWADLMLVAARTDGGIGRAPSLSVFLVDAKAAGVKAYSPTAMNGHEAGPVAEVSLVDVEIDDSSLVGGVEGAGLNQLLRGINHARSHVAATAVGQATRLLAEASEHCRNRHQFGQPLAALGSVENTLGRCLAEVTAGRAMVLECARAFDRKPIPRNQIAATKYFCTEMAFRVADSALQLLGGEGIVGDGAVPRMWRDVRALRIYEGASEVHEHNLGRVALKTLNAGDVHDVWSAKENRGMSYEGKTPSSVSTGTNEGGASFSRFKGE